MTKLIESVVVIFQDEEGRVLLLKRHPATPHGGKWGFPGGKIDLPETPAEAAIREVQEETGLYIDLDPRTVSWITYPPYKIGVFHYAVTVGHEYDVDLNPGEHTEYTWADPYDALEGDLAGPGTEHLMEMLAKGPTFKPENGGQPSPEPFVLAVSLDQDKKVVHLSLGKSVRSFDLPPDEARTLGQMLIDKANAIKPTVH